MKKFSAIFMLLCLALGLSAQSIVNLAYFPFSQLDTAPNTQVVIMSEDGLQQGTAGLYFDGTHGSSSWTAASELNRFSGTTVNALEGYANSFDLAIRNSTANDKSFVFNFSTTGFQNPVLSFGYRRSGTGFNSLKFEYSTDGTNFVVFSTLNTADYSSTYTAITVDFTGVAALSDQANAYIRITPSGCTSGSGNNRFDNVQINAYPAGPDVWGPTISSVVPTSATNVNVTFNEAVSATTAENTANYVLDNGVTVSNAALTGNMVALTTTPMAEGNTFTLIVNNVADAAGNIMEPDTFTFTYGVSQEFQCATIADLRSKLDYTDVTVNNADNVEYKLTGEVVVTAVAAYNNQKVIQDATGAILVFDPNNKLGAPVEVGDKISGIYGTLTNYYGFLEFKPTQAYETMVSSFNDVTPMEVTLTQLNDQSFMIQHQAELMKMNNVSFTDAGNTFAVLNTYEITQNGVTATAVYPYFQDADYIGATIPTTVNLIGFNFSTSKIGSNYPDYRYYIVPRSGNDFQTGIRDYENAVSVYPNPANDVVNFQINTLVENVMIFDINGKFVANENATDNRINVSNLNNGVYFARLYMNNEIIGVAKIVKF